MPAIAAFEYIRDQQPAEEEAGTRMSDGQRRQRDRRHHHLPSDAAPLKRVVVVSQSCRHSEGQQTELVGPSSSYLIRFHHRATPVAAREV